MPSEKRSRKREARMARVEAERAAARRSQARRRVVRTVIAVVAIVGLVFVVTQVQGGDDEQVASTGTSSTTSTTEKGAAVKTGSAPCPKADGSSPKRQEFDGPPRSCIDATKSYTATVKTDAGEFEVVLDAKRAPKTVNNFVFLARYHYYDGITFHRVIPGFVVQGGDPKGDGTGGPGYTFADELPKQGEYEIGSLAMANSGPDTNGSQFFVITGDNGVKLPPSYSLFGKVTKGMDVVKKIEADGSESGTPTVKHSITSITIKET